MTADVRPRPDHAASEHQASRVGAGVLDVREAIRGLIDGGEVDPHVIAAKVVPAIPDEQLRDLVAELLPDLVRELIRAMRKPFVVAPTRNGKADVGAATRDPRTWPTWVGRQWRLLSTLTADDCEIVARQYQAAAEANTQMASRYMRLAEVLRAQGAETVADLPADMVTKVLS